MGSVKFSLRTHPLRFGVKKFLVKWYVKIYVSVSILGETDCLHSFYLEIYCEYPLHYDWMLINI